jgi:predicted nucleotidyltransferase
VTSPLDQRLRDILARRAGIRFAILNGSTTGPRPDQARDVDVAVSFVGPASLFELGALAVALEQAIDRPVEVVDVDEATTLLRWEIVRTGRVLVAIERAALGDFLARVPIEYADLRPYLDREAQGLRRALGHG